MPFLLVRVDPETFRASAIRDVRAALERHPGPVPELLMELLRAGAVAEPAPDPWWDR